MADEIGIDLPRMMENGPDVVSARLRNARALRCDGGVGAAVPVVWLATGPILTAMALAVPAGLMYRAASGGISISEATGASVAVLLATLLLALAFSAVAGSR